MIDQISKDFWKHVGGLIAIGIGVAGWYSSGLNHDPSTFQLTFMIGGLAVQGVLFANGAASAAAQATKQAIYDAATIAAQEVMTKAAAQAVGIREVAVKAAETLAAVPVPPPPPIP